MLDSEFRINQFLTLRLERRKTHIYVNNKKFIQCKFLLIEIPIKEVVELNELQSVDEFSERFGNPFNIHSFHFPKIPPEVEFWGHCSNLQVWAENNYDTNLLHSNIAFPLLKKLSEVGEQKASKVFKEEIVKRIESGYVPTIIYLIMNHYLDFFTQEEFDTLMDEIIKEKHELNETNLDLICTFERDMKVNDLIFLVSHPKINLFEILIKFGKKLWDKDGEFIGEYRSWTGDLIRMLNKHYPLRLENIVRNLIKKDIIKLRRKKEQINSITIDRVDYSLMDEFSIRLFNALYYGQKKTFWLEEFFVN
ncbi:MAG: hypothetical protein ACFFAI_09920 [Promethearchaeota archaeon]